jgi:E3 ubiquitin-protein ligase RBX1
MAEENKEVDVAIMDESSGVKDDSSSSSNVAPRFEIKKWNAVTMWSWDICADTCAICRNSLNEPSIEYQVLPNVNTGVI